MKRRLAAVSLSGALAVLALAASPAANARVDLNISLGLPGVVAPPPVVYAPPGNYGPPPPVAYNGYYGPGWNRHRPPPRPPMRRPGPPPGRGPGPGGPRH